MSIVRIAGSLPAPEEASAYRSARIVINSSGVVIKDRQGIVPRHATEYELAEAVTL